MDRYDSWYSRHMSGDNLHAGQEEQQQERPRQQKRSRQRSIAYSLDPVQCIYRYTRGYNRGPKMGEQCRGRRVPGTYLCHICTHRKHAPVQVQEYLNQ